MNPTTRRVLLAGLTVPVLAPRLGRAQTRTVIDTLAADGRFDRFIELISRSGMTETLRGVGPFTLFAPLNQAFLGANQAMLDNLLNQGTGGGGSGTGGGGGSASGGSPDPVRLPAFVRYYVVQGQAITLAQLTRVGEARLTTLNGAPLVVVARPGAPATVANPTPVGATGGFGAGGLNLLPPVQIVQADIPATNGVVHAIGGVIAP